MTDIIDLVLFWLINGFTTAVIITINDRIFKRRIDKAFDKLEKKIKELAKDSNNFRGKNVVDFE